MGKIVILFWSFLLGQVVGYIGGALNSGSYNFIETTIVSLIAAVLIMIIGEVALPKKKKEVAR
ncbi:YjzD family protein [Vagococcus sp.]|uniref:YjzD family protein n=1 Tax=Vagococcus sp. TaxID=1933889 RepID=UPI003F9DFE68